MPVYKYSGRTTSGEMKKGTITANSEKEAIAKLRNDGIHPREIVESTSILHKEISIDPKVKNEDFVIYCRQFATLIRAGISIVEATHILAGQTSSKPLKNALFTIEEEVRAGTSFSSAAQKNEAIFPSLFVNMMRVAEATGNLDSTLDRLANYYEKQFKLKKSIQSTLIYPLVLLIAIIVVSISLLVVVVPRFSEMFEDFGAELPFITIFVLGISDFLQGFWWIFLLFGIGVPVIFNLMYKRNTQFHYQVHYILLKLPIFGPLLQKSAIAQMTRTLSSLFSSSVPILQALKIVERVVNNPIIGKVIKEAHDSLEKGSTLSAPLEKSWLFPPLVTQMTAIGEQTGSLDYMLEKVADFYEDDVDRTVDSLKALIEPLMIIILAIAVGTIVLSIMVPMFSLFEQM
ncbi:type II secretion system F family protein [Sporosarcina pasteurii]|uniref:Cholera toxin secretion protein epsF n=1 Tax=Sporosarcina pasteurii TaxID=1474 RepID=A0A380BVJ4_SPOPA|nr:type II secretion system F family protein [Sporosarcina pasteurii]MDS9471336.1 type II secretion system F family protein [Sporosarcina pasteurii]QBQ05036.1 type II secretion system F family protein [Sporosarcina pasteurii]SUJ07840.1 Cholera toxin secretion protein epsF [Sporosarcina pasteurii]